MAPDGTYPPRPELVDGRQVTVAELATRWRRESAGYVEPIRHVLLTCAAAVEAALMYEEDPARYAALTADEMPPLPPEDRTGE